MQTTGQTPQGGFHTYKFNPGKGQTLGFTQGKGYYARTAPVARGQVSQPGGLQPLSGAQIANEIAGYVNQLPAPLTDQQIEAKANSLISPIVDAITGRITSAERQSAGAITGYANQLASNLAGLAPQVEGIYSRAQQAQASANAAETGAIRGTGTQLAGQVAGDIAKLDGPAGLNAATVGPVQTAGSGAAAAMLGTGSSFLDQLIAEGASAAGLAAKQPGFAELQGLSDVKGLSLQSQKQLADALAQEQQQVPGLVQSLEQQSAGYRTNRANAADSERRYLTARNDALSLGSAKNKAYTQAANAKAAASLKAAKANAAATVQTAKIKASEAAAKDAKPDATWSNTNGYVSDGSGNPIPDKNGNYRLLPGYTVNGQGRVVKITAAKAAKGSKAAQKAAQAAQTYADLGKAQVTHLRAGMAAMYNGVPATATTPVVPPLGYGQAVARAIQQGYSKADAITMANEFYPPGTRGRPASAAQVRSQKRGAQQVRKANADARRGKDATGLGIQVG